MKFFKGCFMVLVLLALLPLLIKGIAIITLLLVSLFS